MKTTLISGLKVSWKGLFPLILLTSFLTVSASAQTNTCPDTSAALTPAPLEEEWAVEWWMPRHEEKLKEEGRESAEILLIGNSITHGWENEGKDVWESYFGDYGTFNIGYSGDRTENVLWRFEHGELDGINPKLALLMIGTNNTGHRQDPPECTTRGIEIILEELKDRLPETKIVLLAIFPRSESPDDELRKLNNEINNRIEKIAENEDALFLDINHIFLNDDKMLPEEIMPDFLHPNEKGYELWAKEIEPTVLELLTE